MPSSVALRNRQLTQTIKGQTWYVALSTVLPSDGEATGFARPSGGAYADVAMPPASWGTPADGQLASTAAVTFPTPTATWGTVVAVGYADTQGGPIRHWRKLADGYTIANGGSAVFPAGALVVEAAA